MTPIAVQLLGSAGIRGADERELPTLLRQPKRLGLLSYLLIAQPRGFHRRDKLVALFWPEANHEQARHALSQALHVLRNALGEGTISSRGEGEVAIEEAQISCDVVECEQAVDTGEYEKALELYRGDLLEGLFVREALEFERWLEDERVRLREKASGAAWELAHQHIAAGQLVDAERTAQRALLLVSTDESEVRRFIQALSDAGDRAAAVRFYEKFARRLKEEYDIDPAPATVECAARVRDDKSLAHWGPTAEESPAAGETMQETPATVRPEITGRPRGRVGRWVGAAAAVSIVALLGVWAIGSRGADLVPQRVFVAVFDNRTGNADLEPLGSMAADWIAHGLQEVHIGEVVPAQVALLASDGAGGSAIGGQAGMQNTLALAKAARAGRVVSGAYYEDGDSLRFQAQVINVASVRLINSVDAVMGSVASSSQALEELRQRVVGTLAVEFDARSGTIAFESQSAPSWEAYNEYLEGMRDFWRGNLTEAIAHLAKSSRLDSTYMLPLLFQGWAYGRLNDRVRQDSIVRTLDNAREHLTTAENQAVDVLAAMVAGDRMAALQASRSAAPDPPNAGEWYNYGFMALQANYVKESIDAFAQWDPASPGVQGALARHYWRAVTAAHHMLGDHRQELREARRDRRQYPSFLTPLVTEVRALAALGRLGQVEALLDESFALTPDARFLPTTTMLVAVDEFRAHGNQPAADQILARLLAWYERQPEDAVASESHRRILGDALARAERWDEVRSLYQELAVAQPKHPEWLGRLGVMMARVGDRDGASDIDARLATIERPYLYGQATLWRARIAAVLGEPERAVVLLRNAFAEGLRYGIWLHRDIDLESLRDYAPFRELMRPKGQIN